MKLTSFGFTAALLTFTLAAPAFAQERNARQREAARAEQNAQRQAQPQREAARGGDQPARVEAPRAPDHPARVEAPRSPDQSRTFEQARPRREEMPRVQAPVAPAPSVQAPVVVPRADERPNAVVGRAVPRTSPSYNADRERYDRERYDRERYDRERGDRERYDRERAERDRQWQRERNYRDSRYYGYSPRYAPHAYVVRPYVFRPRVSIGFGIFAGYPAPYAWRYSAPIYIYGYRAPRAPVYVTPGMSLYGGIALEMSPYDADVFVDGNYAGKVYDFDGTVQPLTVVAGVHRIEVQAPGYAPLVFDVAVEGGQVIPYRGDLRPY